MSIITILKGISILMAIAALIFANRIPEKNSEADTKPEDNQK